MNVRAYRGEDIGRILAIWQKEAPFCAPDRNGFIRKTLLEENFSPDGLLIAENESGDISGFVIAVARRVPVCAGAPDESNLGFYTAFCVPGLNDPADARAADTGRALVTAAENYLRSLGRTRVSTGFYPFYYAQGFEENRQPGYCALFESLGYRGGRSFSLSLDMADYRENPRVPGYRRALADDGFYVGPLTPAYLPSLLDPGADFSSPSWSREFAYRVAELDFDCVRIAAKDGRVIGAAACDDRLSRPGRFGPFGVSPALRGRGIGSVLLADALAEMKRRGVKTSWMQWVGDGGAAYRLYTGVGYQKANTFLTFSKTL